jgi:hypothetical protein
MKDLSEYIESIIDGVISDRVIRGLNVAKDDNTYIITINAKNFHYTKSDKGFVILSDSIAIRRHLEIYFPNDDIKFEIKHTFV